MHSMHAKKGFLKIKQLFVLKLFRNLGISSDFFKLMLIIKFYIEHQIIQQNINKRVT